MWHHVTKFLHEGLQGSKRSFELGQGLVNGFLGNFQIICTSSGPVQCGCLVLQILQLGQSSASFFSLATSSVLMASQLDHLPANIDLMEEVSFLT